ncbi:hypothetical protein [Athalassotoga saccharophila]|uniref:hypothetical protein n=1 Tax=Athalassotoga saccharophila TaxID=1441386 RepID=UPI00137A2666|nr:hypothetical protein [Athalassotoga saccharophila]BBJ29043.1 hypothetical protein ATHSA_1973 [Athalassotoga saccharophila]
MKGGRKRLLIKEFLDTVMKELDEELCSAYLEKGYKVLRIKKRKNWSNLLNTRDILVHAKATSKK